MLIKNRSYSIEYPSFEIYDKSLTIPVIFTQLKVDADVRKINSSGRRMDETCQLLAKFS